MRYIIMVTFIANGYPNQFILATTTDKEVAEIAINEINSQEGLTGFYVESSHELTRASNVRELLLQRFLSMKR